MQFSDNTTDLEQQLALLDEGKTPAFAGPKRFHGVLARNRRRLINHKLKKQRRRASRWLSVKRTPCRGPSSFQMMYSQLAGYLLIFLLAVSLVWFVLWYFGIWKYLVYVFNAIGKLISGFVRF